MKTKYVYLLHFDEPLSPNHTSQHYAGSAKDLAAVLQAHWQGSRSRCVFTAVAKQREISFRLVRAWRGDRQIERQFKSRKNHRQYCPVCKDRPWNFTAAEELSEHELEEALLPF